MASILDILNNPYILAGGGLTGLSALGRDEPGYVTEARQAVRNIQQPTGYTSVFKDTVSGLQDQFLPLLQQQAERGIADISQRYAAAGPATLGMQGSEIAGLTSYLRDQLVPTQQAFLGNLGITGIGQQQNAAQTILKENTDDPLRQGIATLAAAMLLKGIYGGGTGTGTGFGTGTSGGLGDLIGKLFGGGGSGGAWQGSGLFGGASSTGQLGQLANLGLSLGNPVGSGREVLDATGYPVGVMGANGTMTDMYGNPMSLPGGSAGTGSGFFAPQAAGTTGLAGMTSGTGYMGAPGFGTAGGLMSGFGSAAGGYAAGSFAAPHLTNFANRDDAWKWLNPAAAGLESLGVSDQGMGAFTGAQSGALVGFAVGGPVGAVIGAIAGGIGGFTKARAITQAQKAANLKADQDSQSGQSRTVADFFLPAIEQMGGNTSQLQEQVAQLINSTNEPGDQQGQIAQLLGDSLLKQAKTIDPSITSLDSIPGFRQNFMAYMIKNAYTSPQAGQKNPMSQMEATALGAQAGFDSATPGINKLNVNQYGDISHTFQNVDRASQADVDAIVNKIRQAGWQGALPSSLTTPLGPNSYGGGRPLLQVANQLIQALRQGATTPQQAAAIFPGLF